MSATLSEAQASTRGRVETVRQMIAAGRQVLEGVMADVTAEQVHYTPPGTANPLGATYAHVVCSEDMIVQGLFRQGAPLLASSYAGKTGLSEPMPAPGPDWVHYGAWTRRVRVDLPSLKAYAQAVYTATDAWLDSLADADLDRPMDLSGVGLGQQTWGSAIALLLVNHLGTEAGEIAVLKGIQGAKGYPF